MTARRTIPALAALGLVGVAVTPSWPAAVQAADPVLVIEGFSGPESVRYDPGQDVYFVGNFNGDGGDRDANGFVSRVSAAAGTVETLRFAVGTDEAPLHAPRGMFITGDTLWVVDIDGLHGFDRRTGEQRVFVDLSRFEPGFLNDVAAGPDGAPYVTDTGRSAVYRAVRPRAELAVSGPRLGSPNGITWDPARRAFVLVPWEPGGSITEWSPDGTATALGESTSGRRDGVEPFRGRLLIASQADSSIHVLDTQGDRRLLGVRGAPADIAVDTRRGRVAVPYISLNRVDVWVIPETGVGGGR